MPAEFTCDGAAGFTCKRDDCAARLLSRTVPCRHLLGNSRTTPFARRHDYRGFGLHRVRFAVPIDEDFQVLDREKRPPTDLRQARAASFVDQIAQGSPRQRQRPCRAGIVQKQDFRARPLVMSMLVNGAIVCGGRASFPRAFLAPVLSA